MQAWAHRVRVADPVTDVNDKVDSEEEIIARYFAPLAERVAGTYSLADDCALYSPEAGEDLVVTVDAVAEGVHFPPGASAADIAWRALAVNVSDLAAKAAKPSRYVLAISFPEAPARAWLSQFTAGLQEAHAAFGIALIGGDTDRRPGPLSIVITAFGTVPQGKMVRRGTARAGDRLFVTGTLGDARLGLALERGEQAAAFERLSGEERAFLLERFRRPRPRLALRDALLGFASASMDLSDGLAKDARRLCGASGVAGVIGVPRVPLSEAARKIVVATPELKNCALNGGDDYELLVAVPPGCVEAFCAEAASAKIPVSEIGSIEAGNGLRLIDESGSTVDLRQSGWDHFA